MSAPVPRRAGFTLVEVAVVLAILAVVAAAAAPALTGLRARDATTAAADEVARVLRRARATALEQGAPVVVVIDPESGRYWVDREEGEERRPLAEGVLPLETVRLVAATSRVYFRFEPGGAIGGEPLEVRGARTLRIDVERWKGGLHVTSR